MTGTAALPQLLPPLREDLRLHEAAPDRDGAPNWTIQDPVRNKFFRIGWLEFECLLRWERSPEEIAADISASSPLAVDPDQVMAFAGFLQRHQLLRLGPDAIRALASSDARPDWRHWRWWLHHYLFFRIPLVRPERQLALLLPLLRPLGSRTGLMLVGLASVVGLLLAMRQWESFTQGIGALLTPAGIAGFLLALGVAKIGHELGHAIVATRYGVRVAHMGIAFVVLWPMLYTDTSESWKLRDSRQRLAVAAAGIVVELSLAGVATLAWALLDDGQLRIAMLYLATTGWVVSLALNLSPFMRFDGYFIVSDLLDFPNLHERAGAAARAWLRRALLGWREPDPEPYSPSLRHGLIAFALLTWAYRLSVFLGIAVAVYLFFFKALGIFLLAVEISWFVVRPIAAEITVWRRRFSETGPTQKRRLALLGVTVGAVLLFPWASDVNAPAIARPAHQQPVFSPFPASLVALAPAGIVAAGTPLAGFENPDLQARALRTDASVEALGKRIRGLAADDGGIEQRRATEERLGEQLAERAAAAAEAGRLNIGAEFKGLWLDVDPGLRPGVWVGNRAAIGVLVDPALWIVDAYVDQRQVERLKPGAAGRFYPERRWEAIDTVIIDIDPTRSPRLPYAALDARHGGPITTQTGDREGSPSQALYRVRLELATPLPEIRETRGQVSISGSRRSLAGEWITTVIAVLIRESGF